MCKNCWNREYGKPIKRTELKKSDNAKPIKRTALKKSRTPIRKVAVKRKNELDEYYIEREKFLKEKPFCELKVDSGCTRISTEIHHGKGRENKLLLDKKYWKAGCRHCHDIVGVKSKAAIENGQSFSRHKKSSEL